MQTNMKPIWLTLLNTDLGEYTSRLTNALKTTAKELNKMLRITTQSQRSFTRGAMVLLAVRLNESRMGMSTTTSVDALVRLPFGSQCEATMMMEHAMQAIVVYLGLRLVSITGMVMAKNTRPPKDRKKWTVVTARSGSTMARVPPNRQN